LRYLKKDQEEEDGGRYEEEEREVHEDAAAPHAMRFPADYADVEPDDVDHGDGEDHVG
jgi:hypothetical protein